MNLSKCVSITYLFLFSGGVESVDRIKIDNATFYSMKPFEYIFFLVRTEKSGQIVGRRVVLWLFCSDDLRALISNGT